jgi:FKBP-type peptidyl-prolyl cis-trans isomerase
MRILKLSTPKRAGLLRVASLACALAAVPAVLHAQREKLPPDDLDLVEKTWPHAKKTSTGIRYVIEREGKGDCPVPGEMVSVLYAGTLLQGGKEFDHNRAHPFVFRLARGYVIQGWDQVIQLMKPGEKRLVIVPPELAYGTHGQAPSIPRDATLVFEIELLSVKRDT